MSSAPRGVATGIGSLPLDDIDEALRLVMGELPELPYLPELPDRGAGAGMVGRTSALLVGLHVDLQPAGWRLVPGPSHDEEAARALLRRDLDALEVHALGLSGPLKLQVCGPWTLAATLELTRGDKVLGDAGALRDVAASLAEGVAEHVRDVQRRVPGAELVIQIDEPALPQVLAGRVPTASGWRAFAPVEQSTAADALDHVLGACRAERAATVLHCCGESPPYRLLGRADAVSVDAAHLEEGDDDACGELVEREVALWLGLVPALGPGVPPTPAQASAPARRLWRRLGFAPEQLAASVAVTPACGHAGASMGWVRSAMALCRRTARVLAESPEEV